MNGRQDPLYIASKVQSPLIKIAGRKRRQTLTHLQQPVRKPLIEFLTRRSLNATGSCSCYSCKAWLQVRHVMARICEKAVTAEVNGERGRGRSLAPCAIQGSLFIPDVASHRILLWARLRGCLISTIWMKVVHLPHKSRVQNAIATQPANTLVWPRLLVTCFAEVT